MINSQDPVRLFESAVHEAFGFEPSPKTTAQLKRALSRVGRQNEYDLVAAVVLACFEGRAAAGRELVDHDVRQAVWRVVKNTTRRAARAAGVDPHRIHPPLSTPRPEETVAKREELDKVMRAVAELSLVDQALLMRWLEGASADEIGKDADMTPDAVRQRVSRALKKLRQVLKPE